MLVKIFEEQVKKHPHKIAVRWEKGFLTYLELNRFANRVARLIEKKCTGVGKGERIGLLFDHGVYMIVAILGTLKADGVYVPLSVDYPGNRISYMLSDSKSFLLLSHSSYLEMAEKLAGENGIDFITIDKPASPIPEEDKQREVRSSQLAYIMYTSGSTGKPKGVMQTHENVMYFIKKWTEKFSITNGDRMTLFSSFCHDASIPDLFTGLHNGALLYPYSMKSREENIELSHFLVRERINIWHSVPSLFSYFANTLRREEQFRDLRLIILGGEAVREHEVRLFKKYFPYAALANLYGQTEATFISVQLIGHEDYFERVTIGTPIDGTRVFVIDEQGNPVEPLEPGEILVVCDHVSPGYWQQKEATAAAFGEAEEFGKLYWTGDLGCLLPEGEIEFLGRKDFQVKIRGFRIELGEIENQLLKHDKISETVVVSREDENGDKYLCAYIVASAANAIPASTELREYLSQILPDYMIPTYFMQLEKLPLTPNGKIDRKALPHSVMKTEGAYVPPRNPMEMKLASLWAGILGLEKKIIGINHNFFSLGGHSLKAVSLIAKIHREFNVKLPLALVFKRPTIRGIAASIQKAVKDEFSAITPIEKKEYYALSSAQKRLYFLQQLDLNSTGYNMPFTLPLGKDIEKDKLESTLKQLISRHEGLRTSFVMIGEEPYQRIHDDVDFKIEYYDLQVTGALTHGHRCRWEQEVTGGLAPLPIDHAAALISSFIRPFDLTREPLIRSRLIKQPDNSFIWMVDMHHIVSDGTSNVILAEDFMSRYKGEELPSLPLQYKDFSHWQTDLFTRGGIKSQEDYWLSLYSGEIPRLQLPTDFKRPKVFTFTGDRYRFKLEGEDAVKSRKLAHRHGGTLYMNILAVLNVLFYKYTGQKDIIIGSGTAGRSRVDLQRIIGMFVNTLAMRNHPEGYKTYESFLEEVVANSVNAFENQDVQFEELVDRLVQERDTSRNPLFDISMVVQNFQKIGKTGSTGENTGQVEVLPMVNENLPPIKLKNPTSKFDMTFFVHEAGDNIHIIIEYYTGIFKPDTIKRLTWHFQTITRTIIENPAIKLMEIDIISEEEKKQVLYEFNDTEADYPRFKTLHAIFEDQAAQAPDHIAVVQGESMQFTYRQLNESAQKIARYLYRQKEVKPGEPVGIWMSPLLIRPVAVLGILKAGGVYVPLDPLLPQQRLKYMIRDSCINIVISEKKYLKDLNRLQWECDCFNSCLCVDSEDIHRENILEKPEPLVKKKAKRKHQDDMSCPGSFGHDTNSGLISTVWSHNTAYIIYTSGTTGMPKGVMIEHRSVVNLCYWHNRMYQITRSDHAALYAGFGFDASAWELFPYLLTGAALYMVDESLQLDIEGLNRYFQRCHITIGFLPTQLCEQFMCLDNTNSSLRVLLTGGDKLRTFTPRGYRLYNNYGPTENTVVTTAYPVTAFSENIPIGKPIDNSRIYILDKESYHLQPPGIPGELCIAGAGLARGYLNRPELTKARFCLRRPGGRFLKKLPPWTPRKNFLLGAKRTVQGICMSYMSHMSYIYRTGDLARWLPDGNIEFIGRIDHQVKIRGYRIELGEIESRLLTHHSIKETVVVDRDHNSGDKYLCAYIVSSEPMENLDKYLSRWLPDYMIPSYFVPMEKIPLTPNGKVDRSKLSKPGITSKEAYLPPRDKIEEKLAEIWSEVLGLSHHSIGIDDNFFKLGGHSLKATALVSRIHKNLNVKISLVQVFNTPTIQQLAEYIKTHNKKINITKDDHLVLLKKGKNSTNHLFFIHDGSGKVEGYINFCNSLDPGYNCWGIKAEEFDNYAPKNIKIEELAAQYIKKLEMIQPSGPYYIVGWSLGGTIAFEMVNRLEQKNQIVDFLAIIDAPPPNRDSAPPPNEFTLESELKWSKNYLPPDIYEKIQNASSTNHLWEVITAHLESDGINIEAVLKRIKKLLAQYGGRGITNNQNLSISEMIRDLNVLRSFNQARAAYIPSGKINTSIRYFKASESEKINHKTWEKYSIKPLKVYEIQGSHYSIFRPSSVADFAKKFEKIRRKTTCF